jgi:hypothetical protein
MEEDGSDTILVLVERCLPVGASVTCLYRHREQPPYMAYMVCTCTCRSTTPYTYRTGTYSNTT